MAYCKGLPKKAFRSALVMVGLVLAGILSGCQTAQSLSDTARAVDDAVFIPEKREILFEHQGRTRSAIIRFPEQFNEGRRFPVIIDLHGGGGNALSKMRSSGMVQAAEDHGFIAVFPNGSGRSDKRLLTWNSGNCCGYAEKNGVDDLGFIDELITILIQDFRADPKRIFVSGMSNGGMMAYAVGCGLSERIAGIAVVAGAMDLNHCRPAKSLPVILFHGTADQHVLYGGGRPEAGFGPLPPDSRSDASVYDAVSFWVANNRCSRTPEKRITGPVLRETYLGPSNRPMVVVYTIEGGGHAWPGGQKPVDSEWLDEPYPDLPAAWIILDFFSRF